ncbi:hypothetical protein SYNTR_0305 [Candidatus Syntrophocurvum alkaliphilum]|uniref:PRC-barrel domain-containing protein n=1 Tax=Candidatus Syntrophocurvum alkaliphilum TaxID=2293317 RepID=A0A6I6DEB6_9FIRM|nr:hypothetical protein [Candidatus Syntrophocurvum alkaliphilum]QGT98898.1 hypothetical protein SYNTR_0305 [Candidatus Syntrophocurvum alkaliphilum]
MKLRNLKNLPVFYRDTAQVIGRVERAIIGDSFEIAYLIINSDDRTQKMIKKSDFHIGHNSIVINDLDCIKSYAHGEELTIYEQKIGDTLFDKEGKELGVLSDFVVVKDQKQISGVEVSSGIIQDLLEGRQELPLDQIHWASAKSGVINEEGGEETGWS